MKKFINTLILLLLLAKCSSTGRKDHSSGQIVPALNKAKPGSSFRDTLTIKETCVVFYQPDSLQKERIKAVTAPGIFQGSMHEFFYQQRSARIFLQKFWPELKIIDAKNIRYLCFIKRDSSSNIIDLDKLGDSFGILVFSLVKVPQQIDMTNIDSQIPAYFNVH